LSVEPGDGWAVETIVTDATRRVRRGAGQVAPPRSVTTLILRRG
jgi:hypothetical protein